MLVCLENKTIYVGKQIVRHPWYDVAQQYIVYRREKWSNGMLYLCTTEGSFFRFGAGMMVTCFRFGFNTLFRRFGMGMMVS
jgi:hypothetical protein